jgi:hypothetical protein
MNIPTFARVQFVQGDGYLTSAMQLYNDELNQALQNGLSDNGWTVPQLTTTQITNVASTMPNGTLWYDTTTNQLKGKINGVVTVIV